MPSIAPLEVIGQRLENARASQNKTPRDVMAQIDPEGKGAVATWYRWTNAQSQGGCHDIARVALYLGLLPNDLLLDQAAAMLDRFRLADKDQAKLEELNRLVLDMMELFKQAAGAKVQKNPIDICLSHFRSTLQMMRAMADTSQSSVPPGTSYTFDKELNTKLINPPHHSQVQHKKDRKDRSDRASEDAAPYGKKKRRPKPE